MVSGTTYYHPALLPMMAATQTTRIRRPLAQIRPNRYRRNVNETQMAEPSPDDLYRVLLLAAESYVRLKDF